MSPDSHSPREPDSLGDAPPILSSESGVVQTALAPSLPPDAPREPGVGASLALVSIYVGLLVALQVVVVVVSKASGQEFEASWVTAVEMTIAFGITLVLLRPIAGLSWRSIRPRWGASKRRWMGAALIAIGGWLGALEIGTVTEIVLPMPEFVAKEFERLFSDLNSPMTFVTLAILPPVIEETLCRGLLLRALLRRRKVGTSVVLAALVFATMHLNPWQFFYAFWIGLLLGWVYAQTRSLTLCIGMHALNNALSWAAMRWVPDFAGITRERTEEPPTHLPAWAILMGVVLLGAGIAMIRRRPVDVAVPRASV